MKTGSIPAPPTIRPLAQVRRYGLVGAFVFYWRGASYLVPDGFETDGASIPRFFWRVITPFDPRVIGAAIAHDYSYKSHCLTRAEADKMFCEFLADTQVPAYLRKAMLTALRMFGGKAYAR